MFIYITDFVQGGFYVDNGQEYSSGTEVRSGMHRMNPCRITLSRDSDVTWNFICYDSAGNFQRISESSGYKEVGTVVDLTKYNWIRYIRIELHSSGGIEPPAATQLSVDYAWEKDEDTGEAVDPLFPEMPEKPFALPYPANIWRVGSLFNSGLPFHMLMPGMKGIELDSVTRTNDIRIYDYHEPQNGFAHNGIAVLMCSDCVSKCENNGRWDVELTHPIDEYGIWKNIVPENVLKIGGQLFRIDEVEPSLDEDSMSLTAHARHIWYDLADTMIFDTEGGNGANGMWFLEFCFSHQSIPDPELAGYDFGYYSDIERTTDGLSAYGISIAAAVIGVDDCMINRLGGELYRNNFYFSVNDRMEGARDNAFTLRFGTDITKFVQTIDQSGMVSYLHTDDNFGNTFSIWNEDWAIHHHRHGYKKFTYSSPPTWDRYSGDVINYKRTQCPSKTIYKISVPGRELPEEFRSLGWRLRVGDRGKILCSPLGIETVQEITYLEKNELTGEIKNITFGGAIPSLLRPAYMGSTVTDGNSIADKQAEQLQTTIMSENIAGMESYPISLLEKRSVFTLEGR